MRILGAVGVTLALASSAAAAPVKHGQPVLAPAAPSSRSLSALGRYDAVLVQLQGKRGEIAVRLSGGTQIAPRLRIWRVPSVAAHTLVPGLERAGLLKAVEPDRPIAARASRVGPPTDPLLPQEYWLARVGADRATPPGPGKPVAVVDSGVDLTHPEFAGRPDTTALNQQVLLGPDDFHGTAVASVVGAPANGVGLVGVYPQARLQVWDASPTGQLTLGGEIAGIEAAARKAPGVINLSLGSTQANTMERDAVYTAFGEGSLVVAAAGNDRENGNPLDFPANLNHVLTVAATDQNDVVTGFSSASSGVDLAAPGQAIPVAVPLPYDATGYQIDDGTSFSTPIVSGAAAWVWTVRPKLDVTQLFDLMRLSARDVGPAGFDADTGFGILDIPTALSMTAPTSDHQEPNDDIYLVKANGLFSDGTSPVTKPGQPTGSLTARMNATEDPEDVYRVYVPPGKTVTVGVKGNADIDLELWRSGTRTVFEKGAAQQRDLLAASTHKGIGTESASATNRTKTGTFIYADVFLGRKAGRADYKLTVATRTQK